jgi:hypothetical protein
MLASSRGCRLLLALLLALSLSACPARRATSAAKEDPGPPTVLDPMLLDRA